MTTEIQTVLIPVKDLDKAKKLVAVLNNADGNVFGLIST